MRSRALKIGLSVVLFLVVVTILWSFLSRRRQAALIPQGSLLPPEISRRIIEFEYTEHKGGKRVFHVQAELSSESGSGIHTLKSVELSRYDEAGESADKVSAREAVYKIADKKIEFSGDVRIELSDQTRIFSQRTRADLDQEVIFIDESFHFDQGQATGKGQSLIYRIPGQEVEVVGHFQLVIPNGPDRIEAQARGAKYRVSSARIELEGEAEISGSQGRLSGERMEILLTEEKQIRKVVALGEARFQSHTQQTFSGDRIHIVLDSDSQLIRYFEVLGAPKASYEERTPGGVHHLEAEWIRGKVGGRDVGLEQISARRDVVFHSSALQIRSASANHLTAWFLQDGRGLKRLELKENVTLVRNPETPHAVGSEKLRSHFLRLEFSGQQSLERVMAQGNVDVELNSQQGYRHLFARESVQVNYRGGVVENIISKEDCLLESLDHSERLQLRAPLIRARYREGVLEHVFAGEGVVLELAVKGSTRHARSQRLNAFYKEGRLSEAVQSGQFHFWEKSNSDQFRRTDLKAERAVFSARQGKVTITGKKAPVLESADTKTFARYFVVDRETARISAFEEVQSTLWQEGTVVTAARMEADPDTGWIEYSGNPRILREGSVIAGKRVRFSSRLQQLVVEEKVESVLTQEGEEGPKEYWIEADRLVSLREKGVARYEGNVRVKTDDLRLKAPFLDVLFSSQGSADLREIIAQGEVHMTYRDRKAQGNRAVYYPLKEKVVLTGEPARVFEAAEGNSSGRKLTFYIRENKILIEGPVEKP